MSTGDRRLVLFGTAALVIFLLLAGGDVRPTRTVSPKAGPAPPPVAPSPPPAVEVIPETPTRENSRTEGSAPLVSEKWYADFTDGQRSGWTHVIWFESEYLGRPTIHDRTEMYNTQTRSSPIGRDRFESRHMVDVERTPEGDLLWLRWRDIRGSRILISEQRWTGDGYEWVQRVAGQVETRRVDCEKAVPVDSESFLCGRIRSGGVEPGTTLTYLQPNFLEGSMETIVLEAVAHETLDLETGPCRCLRVRQSVVGVPTESHLWLDAKGVLRKLESGNRLMLATSEEEARDLSRAGYSYSIAVRADPYMPRATSLDRAVVEITLAPRERTEPPDFPDTPFSREIERRGDVHVLSLTAHDDPEATVALPVETSDPEVSRWLERTNLFCTGAPEVKAALREAVGEETDGRIVAEKLLEFVFTKLRKGSGPIPGPTAVEILRDGLGDCSEHAVLFVTLCRSAGLPARRLEGYAQVSNVWGSHSFCEIWLGKWVGADPTTNELGTKARYIAFGWRDMPDSYPGLVSTRVSGRMRIRTVEFEEGGTTWRVADLERDGRDERADPLSGLALAEPPEGWTAAVGSVTGTARITGPGVQCDISVRSGFGNLPTSLLARNFFPYGQPGELCGREALVHRADLGVRVHHRMLVPYRRRFLDVNLILKTDEADEADEAAALEIVGEVLAPSLE